MSRLKNITRSLVIVPDAKLRLAPGEAADVAELTPQCLSALRTGCVAKLDPPELDPPVYGEAGEAAAPAAGGRAPAAAPPEVASRPSRKERREPKEQGTGDVLGATLGATLGSLKSQLVEAGGGDS